MRVIIITGERPHHKHLCVSLARDHDIAAIVHPRAQQKTLSWKVKKFRREVRRDRAAYAAIRLATKLKGGLWGWSASTAIEEAERTFFPNAAADYDGLEQSCIHRPADVNDRTFVSELARLGPDVVVCLGGAIYREPLVSAFPKMLNSTAAYPRSLTGRPQ
ncbi:MAG: hypothetical protein FJ405_04695 [Verrucomicrobia bacterium]|nr:hypothetical protein [Verrucomicrobiota bacterium]